MRRPRAVLAAVALVVLAALPAQGWVRIDSRTENILPATSPSVVDYEAFRGQFGTDELILIGLLAPAGQRMVDPGPYALLAEVTRRLQGVAALESETVISLASARVPAVRPGFPLRVELVPLVQEPPRDAAGAERVARRAAEVPLVEGMLLSRDLRAASVIAILRALPAGDGSQDALLRAVESVRAALAGVEQGSGVELHLAGTPLVKAAFVGLLRRDMAVLVPVCFGLIALVLIGLYRTTRAVLLPMSCVILAVLLTLATMGASGYALNTITALLPPLLLSVAIGESIHLVSAWDERRRAPGASPSAALEAAVRETALPCLLTSVTTVAGFASLLVSPILPIREFGLFASLGTLFAFLLTFSLVPAVLSLAPGRPPAQGHGGDHTGRLGRLLGGLARLVVGRPRTVLLLSALPVVASVLATVAWLDVEVDFVRYFKPEHEVPRAAEFFGRHLAGAAPLEVVLQGPPGAFGEPENLRRLQALQARLEALVVPDRHGEPLDAIDRTISVADFMRLANRLQGGGDEIPADRGRIAGIGLLAQMSGAERGMWRLVSQDLSRARLSARMQNLGSKEAATLVRAVQAAAAEVTGGALQVTVTGSAVIFLEVSQAITDSQVSSFGGALVLVFGAMLLVFRSPRAALLCVVPNVFPLVFTFGFMAVSGITLNMGTAMVASIAIGIAVDDTVHFLTGFGRHISAGLEPAEAVTATFGSVGPANLALTLILIAGFGVTALASFYPTIHFGVLSAWTIAVAFYGDFVLLPALLVLLWPREAKAASCPLSSGQS